MFSAIVIVIWPFLTTPAELLAAFVKSQEGGEEDDTAERKKYRYVIYARKSTDAEEKQVRSLADQLTECQEFATEQGLDVRAVIQESESAKYSETRPKFKQMIADLKAGKYDGILAWHPDRLAWNMKDAGEVIGLLNYVIKKVFSNFFVRGKKVEKTTLCALFDAIFDLNFPI